MAKESRKRRRHSNWDVSEADKLYSSESSDEEFLPKVSKLEIQDDFPLQPLSPLHISLIIHEIFRHLKLADLKNCRSVCTLWNEIGAQTIQSGNAGKVTFRNSYGLSLQQLLPRIKEFTALMNSSSNIPYRRYEFHEVSFRNNVMKMFFQICGSSVRYLSISVPTRKSPYLDVQMFTKILVEFTPNLETLHIKDLPRQVLEANSLQISPGFLFSKLKTIILPDCPDTGYYKPCTPGLIWEQIFKASPNLNEIEGHIYYFDHEDTKGPQFQARLLKALNDSKRMATLTKLRFYCLLGVDFDQLSTGAIEQGMTLVEFKVDEVLECDYVGPSMEKFLQSQSNCLNALSLGRSTRRTHGYSLPIIAPAMKNLVSLSLVPEECDAILMKDVDFFKNFPKLTSLSINVYSLRAVIEPEPESFSIHLGVKNLSIGFQEADQNDIVTLGNMFPSVESLKFENVCTSVSPTLWTTWPSLMELDLSFKYYCKHKGGWDEAFGTYSGGIKEMLPELNKHADNPETIRRLLHPSILEMKNLISLTVKSDTTTSGQLLTDSTGIFLFSNMKNLRKLVLKDSRITKQCEEHIRKMLPFLEVLDNTAKD